MKRAIHDQQHTGDQVGQCVFGGEADGYSENASTGNEWHDVDVHRGERNDDAPRHREDPGGLDEQGQGGIVEGSLGLRGNFYL